MSRPAREPLALVQVCAVALWLGATLFFSAAVAPAAFDVLPARSLAGALVGRLLPTLFGAGAVVALVILAIEAPWPRAGRRLRVGAALVMLVACASAQFVVGAWIERLRTTTDGPISALAPEDPRRAAFGRLHAMSVAALGTAMIAAAAAVASGSRAALGARA